MVVEAGRLSIACIYHQNEARESGNSTESTYGCLPDVKLGISIQRVAKFEYSYLAHNIPVLGRRKSSVFLIVRNQLRVT